MLCNEGDNKCDSDCDGSCDAFLSPPPPPPARTQEDTNNLAKASQAKKWVLLALGSYYPRIAEKEYYADMVKLTPPCYDRGYGVERSYFAPKNQLGDRSICGEQVDGWAFQGRVATDLDLTLFGAGWLGQATADVYFKDTNKCLVAITGTNDAFTTIVSNVFNNAWLGGYEGSGIGCRTSVTGTCLPHNRNVAKGFKNYYDAIRDKLLQACAGKTTYVTGHSLGGGAANVMGAYGDASQVMTFASPKIFMMTDDCTNLPEMINYYSQNPDSIWDPVSAVGPALSKHCENNFELWKPASFGNVPAEARSRDVRLTLKENSDPPLVSAQSTLLFMEHFRLVHPLAMTYVWYLADLNVTSASTY